tara:strand:- start:845 stop:1186 length:342 start_codon:yes stop_codon:yes gene_type:complete
MSRTAEDQRKRCKDDDFEHAQEDGEPGNKLTELPSGHIVRRDIVPHLFSRHDARGPVFLGRLVADARPCIVRDATHAHFCSAGFVWNAKHARNNWHRNAPDRCSSLRTATPAT